MYAFTGCIPRESGVGAADFVLNDDPIAAGAIGEECSTKDGVPTSILPGIDPVNAYKKTKLLLYSQGTPKRKGRVEKKKISGKKLKDILGTSFKG